jgi:hypothetical protein
MRRIVAPDGSEMAPTPKPQPHGTLVKGLARAGQWQRMLDQGVYTSVGEIGDAERVTCSPGDPSVDMRVRQQETDDEEEPVQRGADHRRAA